MLKIIITAAMTLVALVSQAQVSESRKITDFSKIEVESGIELTYMESDENSIKVETESKDNLANIITETNGKTLRVYYAKKSQTNTEAISKVFISGKNVNTFKASSKSRIIFDGPITASEILLEMTSGSYFRGTVLSNLKATVNVSSGSVFSGKFETDLFKGNFKSGATVSLTGSAKKATIKTSSGAYCNAKNFFVDSMEATAKTKSSALLNAKKIEANAADSSSITFFGELESLKMGEGSFAIANRKPEKQTQIAMK